MIGMKMKLGRKWILVILGCSVCGLAIAEMRIWEDKKGNTLEAEFQCVVSGKVVLKDRKGKDYKLSVSSLSAKDRKYLETKLPPKVKIEFKKKQDRMNNSYVIKMEGEVVLTKTSQMPYTAGLKATLFMIGEDSFDDEYVLMDKTEYKFDFKTKKTHSFSGEPFKMYDYDYYSSDRGVEYKGYLVVIYDEAGTPVATKSGTDNFLKNIDYLTPLKTGARFPDDMKRKPTRESSSTRTYY